MEVPATAFVVRGHGCGVASKRVGSRHVTNIYLIRGIATPSIGQI